MDSCKHMLGCKYNRVKSFRKKTLRTRDFKGISNRELPQGSTPSTVWMVVIVQISNGTGRFLNNSPSKTLWICGVSLEMPQKKYITRPQNLVVLVKGFLNMMIFQVFTILNIVATLEIEPMSLSECDTEVIERLAASLILYAALCKFSPDNDDTDNLKI
jgi:hypothetical protein